MTTSPKCIRCGRKADGALCEDCTQSFRQLDLTLGLLSDAIEAIVDAVAAGGTVTSSTRSNVKHAWGLVDQVAGGRIYWCNGCARRWVLRDEVDVDELPTTGCSESNKIMPAPAMTRGNDSGGTPHQAPAGITRRRRSSADGGGAPAKRPTPASGNTGRRGKGS